MRQPVRQPTYEVQELPRRRRAARALDALTAAALALAGAVLLFYLFGRGAR